MKWPNKFSNFSQYNEDITLAALFDNKKNGFYVDVGANQEDYHSVTKYFYKRGWRGINIEPIPRLHNQFVKKRTKDINLNIAISSEKAVLKFREYPNHDGLSTFSEVAKKENEKAGIPYKDYDVKVERLDAVFKKHDVKDIDFLKVDVEGYEGEVLKSNDWRTYRPKVICIEANHVDSDWRNYLEQKGYKRYIFDGLNEYYLATEAPDLTKQFAERAAILNHNAIRVHQQRLWDKDLKKIKALEKRVLEQDLELAQLRNNIRSLKFLAKQQTKEVSRRLRKKKQ